MLPGAQRAFPPCRAWRQLFHRLSQSALQRYLFLKSHRLQRFGAMYSCFYRMYYSFTEYIYKISLNDINGLSIFRVTGSGHFR